MIGLANPLAPLCISCGAVIDYDPEDTSGACNECFFDSEAAAAEEKVRDFRWVSRDWLKCHGCGGTGERRDAYCYCHIGQAKHAAEAERFASVRALPALAVCGVRYMADGGIDPQERVAK